jgi:hypothetical protein
MYVNVCVCVLQEAAYVDQMLAADLAVLEAHPLSTRKW